SGEKEVFGGLRAPRGEPADQRAGGEVRDADRDDHCTSRGNAHAYASGSNTSGMPPVSRSISVVAGGSPSHSGPSATCGVSVSAVAKPSIVQLQATSTAAAKRGARGPAPSKPRPERTSVAPMASSQGAASESTLASA